MKSNSSKQVRPVKKSSKSKHVHTHRVRSLSAPPNLNPKTSIPYHRDNSMWHMRTLLFLCEVVASRASVVSGVVNKKLKRFFLTMVYRELDSMSAVVMSSV